MPRSTTTSDHFGFTDPAQPHTICHQTLTRRAIVGLVAPIRTVADYPDRVCLSTHTGADAEIGVGSSADAGIATGDDGHECAVNLDRHGDPDYVNQLEEVMRQSTMGIARVSLDGRIVWANARLGELAGIDTAELIGTHVDELAPPDDAISRTVSSRFIEAAIANQVESQTFSKVIRRADGNQIHVDVTSRLISDHLTDEPRYFLSFVNDVSDRHRLQQRQYQAEKMEAIGHLAASIAHEINNMLGGILGYSEMLQLRLTDPAARQECGVIIDTALEAGQVTRQLLSVARQSPLRPEVVDIHQLISLALDIVAPDPSIDVDLQLDAHCPLVFAERGPLQSVFENLLINSTRALGERRGAVAAHISIQTDNVVFAPNADDAVTQPAIRIRVTDSGIGMDALTLRKAFEPFFTTHANHGAAGLGLAAAHATIVNHGGTVVADSKPGDGATFTITLPVHSETTTTVTNDETQSDTNVEAPNILVVDDDDVMRSFVVAALSQAGYRTIDFGSGHDAIAYFDEHHSHIDLAICDMVMPEMTGRELVRELRTRKPEVSVLMATGIDKNSPDPELNDVQAPILQKPFRLAELTAAVSELLS